MATTWRKRIDGLTLGLLVLLLSACSRSPVVSETQARSQPPASATLALSETPAPSETPLPSFTPTVTSSPTITPTPTATLHPMAIQALRQGSYPGSEIVIVEELERGVNYNRYYAYYLSEGLKIYALLTVPDGEPPAGGWPGIVFNHGYIPPDVYRTTERYIAYVDTLARSGYIVFRIDYRGHDRSEGRPTGAYSDPGYTVDVLNAFSSLQAYPAANPQRIGMWGHSMGGYLTLRAMVINPEIKAGVIWAGVVGSYPDLLTRWRRSSGPTSTPSPNSTRRWRNAWSELYGTPEENPEFWASISSNSYLDDISGPVQLIHGTGDTSVPYEFSQTLTEQLREAGETVELIIYEGDDHNLSQNFSGAMLYTLRFYEQYLQPPEG